MIFKNINLYDGREIGCIKKIDKHTTIYMHIYTINL